MKNHGKSIQWLAVIFAAFFIARPASAIMVTWVGTNGVSATSNWSDANNWDQINTTTHISPANNAANFTYWTAVQSAGLVTVNADGAYTTPGSGNPQAFGLFFGQTNGYHTLFIQPGITLLVQAAAGTPGIGLGVGPQPTNNNTLGNVNLTPSIVYTNYTTIGGSNGTLSLNGPGLRVEGGSTAVNNHYSILDMSGLGTFIMTNSSAASNSFNLINGAARSQGLVYLALTNNIQLTYNFQVGYLASSSNSLPIGIYLGQSNYISTGTGSNNFVVGFTGCTNGFMKFNPSLLGGATMPTAVITGASGNQTATICNASGASVPGYAICDFTGGNVTWNMSLLKIGVSGAASPNTTANGVLTFDNGIITAGSVLVGSQTVSSGSAAVGTINIGTNATLQAGTIGLPSIVGTATFGTAGVINISSNGTLIVNSITNATGGSGTLNLTNANLDLSLTSTSVTNIVLTTLNGGGSSNLINITSITPLLGSAYPVRFHLISTLNISGATTLKLGSFPTSYDPAHPYVASLDTTTTPGLVDLVLTSGPAGARSLTWSGTNASGSADGDWDVATTADWLTNGIATTYTQFDLATFNDVPAPGQTSINLTTTITPFSTTVSNVASPYTLGGGGKISGATGLTKQGTGTLLLDENNGNGQGYNDFTGGVTITGGTVQVGNGDNAGSLGAGNVTNNAVLVFNHGAYSTVTNIISGSGTLIQTGGDTLALSGHNLFTNAVLVTNSSTLQLGSAFALGSGGTGSGSVTIANGSTLDANGNLASKNLIVSGTGVGGGGAITDTGATIGDSTGGLATNITLAGDATFAFPIRWDLGSAGGGSVLSTGGHAYNLTLNGGSGIYFEWKNLTVDSALANINVASGTFGVVGTTTLGNPASTLTLNPGAQMSFYNATSTGVNINKQVDFQSGGVINNNAGANIMNGTMTLEPGYCSFTVANGTSLTLSNVLSGSGILYDNGGSGLLTLAGNSPSFTGGVLFYTGSLALNGTIGSGVTSLGGTTVSGSGTASGLLDISGNLLPGGSGVAGTLTAGGLTLEGGSTLTMDLSATNTVGGNVNDLIVVNGDLSANNNTIYINPIGTSLASSYTLLTYTGNANSFFGGAATVAASRYVFTLTNVTTTTPKQVNLLISGSGGGPALLKWNNAANNGSWDTQVSQNWSNVTTLAPVDFFFTQDSVIFDDSITNAATPTTTISISSPVIPGIVTNNSTTNYAFTGAGKISGGASIFKLGTSTLTIATTNDFTGNVTVAGGTLKAATNAALGNSTGTIYVTNGGTLDLIYSLGNKPLVLSGAGVGGNGALVNNDPSGTPIFSSPSGLLNVRLAGNTTIGGTNRIDFGQNGVTGATFGTGGSNYNLTIVGSTYRQWDNVTLDPNFGNINIQTTGSGALGIVGSTTLGNPANTISVFNPATLGLYADSVTAANVTINKNILLYNGSILQNGSGTNTILSPITLGTNSGDNCTFLIGGTSLTVSNVISGPGNLLKTNSSPLFFAATNTYTGSTVLTAGAVVLTNNGSISTSTNIGLASGTAVDVSGRVDKTLNLASGQTLKGSGSIRGNLTANSGSIVSPGLSGNGTLTVTNAVNLQGTTAMSVGGAFNNLLNATNISYGGTLSLTFAAGSLAAGNSFKLFNAGAYSNSFATITPASPGTGLAWDTSQLTVSGRLNVISSVPPKIGGIKVTGTNLSISGSGGPANGTYHIRTSTNVATALTNWAVLGSNSFDPSGNFSFTNSINPSDAHRFYIIVEP